MLSPPDHVGDLLRFQFLETCQYPLLGAEPDYDLGNTEKERLRPELEKFALESDLVAVGFDLGGGFELNPVDRKGGVRRFAIPDYFGWSVSKVKLERRRRGWSYGRPPRLLVSSCFC